MPRRTNPFQNLSASIMALLHGDGYTVEESVLKPTRRTGQPREIDILITDTKDPTKKIMVECRDWKVKQDVQWIDELYGRAKKLGISRVIAVSSSGFYATTLRDAQGHGIETMHLREAESMDIETWLFRIKEFGLNVDFDPVVKNISLFTSPGVIAPKITKKDLPSMLLLSTNQKMKISMSDYLKGLVADPKIIAHVRANNADEAVTHYDITIPCDPGVGFAIDGGAFIPLQSIVFSIDSSRRSYKVPMRHMRAGEHKVLVGEVGSNTRLIMEEREGQLTVMIECHSQVAKPKLDK